MDTSSSDAARPCDLKQDAATVRGQPSCPPSAQSCDPPAPSSPAQDKPKQSKSRNGCVTCKAKRLKCDETKPTCLQCQKRNVPCGGYKKSYKWLSFEESSYTGKSKPKTQRSDPEERESQCVRQYKCRFINVTAEDMPRAPPAVEAPPSASGSCASFDSRVTPLLEGLDIQGKASSSPETTSGIQLQQSLVAREAVPFPQSSGAFTPTFTSETQPFTSRSHTPLADSEDDNAGGVIRQDIPGDFITLKRKRPGSLSQIHSIPIPSPINFAADSAEMLLLRFDRRTCGILSIKDGVAENPWRTAVTPLIRDTPALYHAVCAMAAFHSTKENASFKYLGMDHMRQSVRTLAVDIESMNIDAALATTLALAFADTWDTHVSTGVHHLRGAKVLFDRAVARHTHMPLSPSDQSRLMFLYNGWMYIAVIAQLTSREDTGFDQIPFPPIFTPQVHEVDPLLGCAASLFPLIGRVAVLVQNVRKVPMNSVAIVSQAMELKTLIEQWAPPRYFKPPEDPTSNIQDSFQTAQAYRWAILLHLHLAVPEIPSESTSELANRILVTLATIPLGSRTLVVQIFPLLVASCEADSEEDRNWARIRWAEMQQRMAIGNIDRCIEVVCEVWKRRDARKAAMMNHQSDIYSLPLDTPVSGACSRHDSVIEPLVFAGRQDSRVFSADDINAAASTPLPETFNQTPSPSPTVSLASSRGDGSSGLCRIFPEYERTVRGNLHWLSVMGDWGWEGSYFMSYNGG
ncbi:C6 finger domain protein, putative [Trichophyton benhamiae CBS 112371]|uniref:C6 finger domain protein, putative n=1 Tax=Arthroderma benhamiae (strain ATCC MYA-4681 / CBS 112371) TaxID=663331 RepID=D4B019_ARTBC|nr:C6 finger domain protein, putative [Trichophyton benhamiae CBS 112371]EFE31394.1 C6 finger domain protein, putative [Trichophyton benhamiae CBS 112371]